MLVYGGNKRVKCPESLHLLGGQWVRVENTRVEKAYAHWSCSSGTAQGTRNPEVPMPKWGKRSLAGSYLYESLNRKPYPGGPESLRWPRFETSG